MSVLTLKVAATAAGKPGKKILKVILSLLLGFLLIVLIGISGLMSVFTGSNQNAENAQETEIYQTVSSYYREYVSADQGKMQQLADAYEEENLVYHTHDNECGYHEHNVSCYRQHTHGASCYTDYTACISSGTPVIKTCGCIYQAYEYRCRLCGEIWGASENNAYGCRQGHSSQAMQQHRHSHMLTCGESADKVFTCDKSEGWQCGKTTETVEYCKAKITIEEYRYISTSYVMAFLSCTNKRNYLKNNTVNVSKEELFSFWDAINSIEVITGGTEDAPTYDIYNKAMSLEDIANCFFNTDAQRDEYKNSVYLISQYIGAESFGATQIAGKNRMDIPLYYQYKSPWGRAPYGNGTISANGCAPTCIAMVFSYLKGSVIYPDDIVEYTGNKYYVNGQGSSWSIFPACAGHWGISCMQISVSESQIASELSAGKPVILSMGPGIFTRGGHFIVLTGIDPAGLVTVNDPNDNERKNFKDKSFSLKQILGEAKGGWSFE